jgi:AcrR family transcriptional regulator
LSSKPRRRPYTPRLPPDERRAQLLDAALAIIARDGYAGVSIDAIAKEAGVTRPVVYGVFDRLGDLLYALLDRTEERALSQLLGALPEDVAAGATGDVIVRTVRGMVDAVKADPLTWRPILLAPEGTPAAVQERIARDRDVMRIRFEALLKMAIAGRPGFDTLDTGMVAHALIGVAEYFGRLIVAEPETFDTERLTNAVRSLVDALKL